MGDKISNGGGDLIVEHMGKELVLKWRFENMCINDAINCGTKV